MLRPLLIIEKEIAALGEGRTALRAAVALKHEAMKGRNHSSAIAAAGAIPPLVALLGKDSQEELQDEAAAALRALCLGSDENRSDVLAAGAVPPLVALLSSESAETQEQAAGLLASLAMNGETASAIVAASGLLPLIRLCAERSCGIKFEAASALRNLAAHPSLHHAIIEAGAAPVLIGIQQGAASATRSAAQGALKLLVPGPATAPLAPQPSAPPLPSPPPPPTHPCSLEPVPGFVTTSGAPVTNPCSLEPVPGFLQGAWIRHYIRRAIDEIGTLGPPCSHPVLYVQTPHAFVDVRPWHGPANEGATMAFAGVTTTLSVLPPGAGSWAFGGARRVSWHACHNWGPPQPEYEACWAEALGGSPRATEALGGSPRATEDVGDFAPVDAWSGTVWLALDWP